MQLSNTPTDDARSTEKRRADTVLDIDSVSVEFSTESGAVQALRNVSVDVQRGETLGIAGESGSGKSTLALAIHQYLDENGEITQGSISFDGQDLETLSTGEMLRIRGNEIAHVPQDPKRSLNPSIRVGEQVAETIRRHQDISEERARERVIELFEEVNITDPEYNARRYPHELSGGMQQRVLIAIAISCNPDLLILDEPTTGLDVTTEAKVLDLIKELKTDYNTSILLITHNLGVIADIADRVAILYAGEIMEKGPISTVFENPTNPYTQGLLAAIPSNDDDQSLMPIPGQIPDLIDVPDGCIFADRCEFVEPECRQDAIEMDVVDEAGGHQTGCRRWETAVDDPIEAGTAEEGVSDPGDMLLEIEGAKKYYGESSYLDRIFGSEPPVKAVDSVSFELRESEAVGLVGESGCGKSTLGECLVKLQELTEGSISYRGRPLQSLSGEEVDEFRSEVQIVFQNPRSSLNPQQSVYQTIVRPIQKFTDLDAQERRERVIELLNQVELGPEFANRYPDELSGGEQQRVAIARAFAANPSVVVLDEPLSALDVSVKASLLSLLDDLRAEYGVAYLLISHDLSVVHYLSDRIAVMYLGSFVETGSKEEVFQPPYHPYTHALLSAVPTPDPSDDVERVHLSGDVPSAREPPAGCRFHTRCPKYIDGVCGQRRPELESKDGGDSHRIACHLDVDEMDEIV